MQEEMVIEVGENAGYGTDDDGNDSLVDDEDRRGIDQALNELTDDCTETPSTTQTHRANATARHELPSTFYDARPLGQYLTFKLKPLCF